MLLSIRAVRPGDARRVRDAATCRRSSAAASAHALPLAIERLGGFLAGRHQSSCALYHAMVSARPDEKSVWVGVHPRWRSLELSIA